MKNLFAICLLLITFTFASDKQITIGVLANRDINKTEADWQLTAKYLTQRIPEYSFTIKAYTFKELEKAVKENSIDFVYTNPAQNVIFESLYGTVRVATITRDYHGVPINEFGSVIFTRADSSINSIADCKQKSIEFLDDDSFGGYIIPMGLFKKYNINVQDFAKINFVKTSFDNIVMDVINRKVDIGAIRTDVLEHMSDEGLIDLKNIKIINKISDDDFRFLHSTTLYPEWSIAKLPTVNDELANKVAVILLSMPYGNEVAKKASYYGWTTPLDYRHVVELMKELNIAPFNSVYSFELKDVFDKFFSEIAMLILLIITLLFFAFRNWVLHNKLKKETEQRKIDEKRSFDIANNLDEGVYVVNLNGDITFANKSAADMLGYSFNELLGQNAHDLFHYKSEDGVFKCKEACEILNRAKEDGSFNTDEEIFWTKDGSLIRVKLNAKLLQKGTFGIVISFTDITMQKELEERLRTSNQIIYKVLNNIEANIQVVDIYTNKVVFANNRLIKLYGNLIGKECFSIFDSDLVIGKSPYLDKSDKKYNIDQSFSWEHKDTVNNIWYSNKANIIKWIDGKLTSVHISFDITTQKELEENLENRVQEEVIKYGQQEQLIIKQSNFAAMGEMLGAIAHQWKQPLNGLSLLLIDLEMDCEENILNKENVDSFLNTAKMLIEHMRKTIDDFKNFLKPDKEMVDFFIIDIVKQVVGILKIQLKQCVISVKILEEQTNVIAYGYPNEFKQVILNIVNNAKDALIANKIRQPEIQICISRQETRPLISITDNAGGITTENLNKIFEPFFTTKEETGGTGIGLSMSKTIIEESMHGSIKVENVQDGAKFTIVL